MRRFFVIVFILTSIIAKGQSAGQLIVKLRNTENDSIKYHLIQKHFANLTFKNADLKKKDAKRLERFLRPLNDTLFLALIQVQKSKVALVKKKFDDSKKYLDSIILPHHPSRLSNKILVTKLFITGNIYYFKFDNKNALEYYLKAYEIAKQNKLTIELIKINNNISNILTRQNQEKKALHHYKYNLLLGKQINSENIINKSLHNLSTTYLSLQELDSAAYYSRMLIDKVTPDNPLLSSAYYVYAKSSLQKKPIDSILNYLEKAIEINKYNYRAYNLLSSIHQDKKQIDLAIEDSKLSLRYAKYNHDLIFIQKNLLELGKLYHLKKDYKKANEYLVLGKHLKDSIQTNENYNIIAKAITKFESEKKDNQIITQSNVLNEKQAKVKRKLFLFYLTLGVILISIMLFSILYNRQKLKNKLTLANKANEERNAIANELHETVGERLTYIISSIDNMLFSKNNDNDLYFSEIKKIKEFATETIAMFRDTLWVLHKSEISAEEFGNRADTFFKRIAENNKHISVSKQIEIKHNTVIQTQTALSIFKIIQEIAQNAIKHSNTDKLDIYFEINKWYLTIRIRDYGIGFDPKKESYSNGLKNVSRKIKALKGILEIVIENGTEVIIKVPIHAKI